MLAVTRRCLRCVFIPLITRYATRYGSHSGVMETEALPVSSSCGSGLMDWRRSSHRIRPRITLFLSVYRSVVLALGLSWILISAAHLRCAPGEPQRYPRTFRGIISQEWRILRTRTEKKGKGARSFSLVNFLKEILNGHCLKGYFYFDFAQIHLKGEDFLLSQKTERQLFPDGRCYRRREKMCQSIF